MSAEGRMKPAGASIALVVVLLVGCRASLSELEPTPPPRADMIKITRTIPAHEVLPGTGARTALLFAHPIPGSGLHVEVRDYYVSEGNEITVAPTSEAVCEIRGGKFYVTAPEVRGERVTGTMWTATPGDRVVVKTTSETAVLRCTYVVRQ
jgi:hypothetical protein